MKTLIIFCLFILIVSTNLQGLNFLEDDVTENNFNNSGGFLKSCEQIYLKGNILSAICLDLQWNLRQSNINLDTCFGFENEKIVYNSKNYSNKCTICKLRYLQLDCKCYNSIEQLINGRIELNLYVENMDGVLKC
jgi:hypothetical protein